MTQSAEGQQISEAPNSIEFTLPISKINVVTKVPTWGQQKAINREAKSLKLSEDDAGTLALIRTSTFNGKTYVLTDELDNFDMRDLRALLKEYSKLLEVEEDEKNV